MNLCSSSNERTNVVKKNIIYSVGIRGINILITLILVPLTINYVNAELYGIWLSLSSIVTWFGFLDIGFGLGMRNRLTTALACHKYKYGKILVSTTYAAMVIVFSIIGILTCIGCTFVDWSYLLKISPEYNETVMTSFQIVVIAFCMRMVLQLITNVCQAFQMTAIASGIDMIGNFISLIFVLILIKLFAPNLIFLSAALCLAPFIAFLYANIWLYRRKFEKVSPSIRYICKFVLSDITKLGGQFFLIQIICVILYQATNIIISHFCGPEQVTVYNIAYKYLNVALLVFSIIQAPIWSAFNDAYALKDFGWMRKIYRKLLFVILLTEIGLLVMVLVSPVVYNLWIGDSVMVPFRITFLISVYMSILLINNLHAMIINGIGKLKLQTITAWIQGVVFIPIVYILALDMKLEGILVALIFVTVIPTFFLIKQVILQINNTASGIYNQ